MSRGKIIALYTLIAITMLFGFFWLTVPLTVLYTVRSSAGWLLIPAALIDGYFGAWYELPLLTIWVTVWWVVSELVRPHVLWQNDTIED